MEIKFEILSVNAQAKSMEVRFDVVGRNDTTYMMHIPVPVENGEVLSGEALNRVVMRYAPVAFYDRLLNVPESLNLSSLVGASGGALVNPAEIQVQMPALAEPPTFVIEPVTA